MQRLLQLEHTYNILVVQAVQTSAAFIFTHQIIIVALGGLGL